MKTKRAGKDYRCDMCGGFINKGDRYARKAVTIGRRGDEWTENINGVPTVVQNWMSYDAMFCTGCVEKHGTPA